MKYNNQLFTKKRVINPLQTIWLLKKWSKCVAVVKKVTSLDREKDRSSDRKKNIEVQTDRNTVVS